MGLFTVWQLSSPECMIRERHTHRGAAVSLRIGPCIHHILLVTYTNSGTTMVRVYEAEITGGCFGD